MGVTPKITSGVRTAQENSQIPGAAEHSRHLLQYGGDARDVVFPGVSNDLVAKLARQMGVGGVGLYKDGHIHLDTGPKRSWEG